MANKMRGEASLKIGDKLYILCYDNSAMIELEDLLDSGIVAITNEIQTWAGRKDDKGNILSPGRPERIRLKWIRALLYVGLKKHQRKMTLEDVSGVMDELGDNSKAMNAIAEGMSVSFGTSSSAEKEDRPTNGDARNGTGSEPSPSTSPTG